VQSAFDWFSRVSLIQKVLVVLFALLLLFSASYLVSTTVFRAMGGGSERANTPSEESSSPRPKKRQPPVSLKISSARWEGQKAVVKGSWKGGVEISSVYCNLLEGGLSGKPTRWWDRSIGTQMDWLDQTFTQEFVAGRETEGWEPLDPEASYSVLCSGSFSGGLVNETAKVQGTASG